MTTETKPARKPRATKPKAPKEFAFLRMVGTERAVSTELANLMNAGWDIHITNLYDHDLNTIVVRGYATK